MFCKWSINEVVIAALLAWPIWNSLLRPRRRNACKTSLRDWSPVMSTNLISRRYLKHSVRSRHRNARSNVDDRRSRVIVFRKIWSMQQFIKHEWRVVWKKLSIGQYLEQTNRLRQHWRNRSVVERWTRRLLNGKMALTEIVVVVRSASRIVFQKIGMFIERRRVFRCTVTIFVGRYARCADRMEGRDNVHQQCRRALPIMSGQWKNG